MKALLDWLDDRTGLRHLVREVLYENIPGGSRWRYVWGSTLVAAFLTQLITGIFLWMAYSPSAHTAWESVYFIQHQMLGGWLLRGIHHFMAQAMVVLLVLHLAQVIIDGAYRAPREVNYWLGLMLMLLVLGLSLTGYLLPWDQKGFWATQVATKIMAQTPLVGDELQQLVVGGSDYGHHTLTRFFALHAGVLPGLLMLILALHVALFRRHGLCAKDPRFALDQHFWPDQVLKDSVACLAVLAVVLLLTLWFHGAELGAPADPASNYQAARPEWYFRFLFQLLKYFKGPMEVIGAIVIPGLVMFVLFLMPLVGRWALGHRLNVVLLLALFAGIGFLTYRAVEDDYFAQWYNEAKLAEDAVAQQKYQERFAASRLYLQGVKSAREEGERILQLASAPDGIPPTGAVTLLRNDPKMQGPKLFRQHCASCHLYIDESGTDLGHDVHGGKPTAPNLYGIGTSAWYAGILDPQQVASEHYFGNTAHREGEMASWVQENIGDVAEDQRAEVEGKVEKIVNALAAQAGIRSDSVAGSLRDPRGDPQGHPQRDPQHQSGTAAPGTGSGTPRRADDDIDEGMRLIKEGLGSPEGCTECHKFQDKGEAGAAPDLTEHGTRAWLVDFISNPEAERFYGEENNDRMPAFAAHQDDPHKNLLDQKSIGMLVDWLRGDWVEPPK